jgi:glutaminase
MINIIDYKTLFAQIVSELNDDDDCGEVATYIPALGDVDSNKFGIHLATVDKVHFGYGDASEKFSIQSVAKVLSLTLALKLKGNEIWDRVGIEPSGSAFNSLVQLEYEDGIPRNPFINAGAIVVCDILVSCLADPKTDLLTFIRSSSGIGDIDYCLSIMNSEKGAGFRNYALANFMKDFGNIHNDIEIVLDLYFHLCSIEMTCEELAQSFLFLASSGVNPITKEEVISTQQTKRINAVMLTCGFYDEAGEFAFRVGLPGKSGVSGSIVAINPGEYCIAVWSPKLNVNGNSYKGIKVLEALTSKTQSSIF